MPIGDVDTRVKFAMIAVGLLAFSVAAPRSASTAKAIVSPRHCHYHVVGGRALAQAIELVQADLDRIVTYEDPNWEDAAATMELIPGLRIPATRALSFEFDGTKAAKQAVLDLIAAYSRQDDSLVFDVREGQEGSGILNVIPVRHLTSQGQMVPDESLLNVKITLLAVDQTYQAVVSRLCELISQQGGRKMKIIEPPPPTPEFANEKISVSIGNKSALWCLNEVFGKYNTNKKVRISWRLVRHTKDDFCALVAFPLTSTPEPGAPSTLRIEEQRPLAVAAQIIERELGRPITYEDPPYLCRCEIMALQDAPQVLRGGILRYSFSREAVPERTILDCIESHSRQGNAGVFALRLTDDVFHIIPVASRNEKSDSIAQGSILERGISFEATGNAHVVLEGFCAATSASTGTTIAVGQLPDLPQLRRTITFKVVDRPAREVLTRLANVIGVDRKMSWQLWYEPRLKGYVVNIREVGGGLQFFRGFPRQTQPE